MEKNKLRQELLKISYLEQTNKLNFIRKPKLIYNNLIVSLAFIDYKNLNDEYKDYVNEITSEIKNLRKQEKMRFAHNVNETAEKKSDTL